MVLDDMNSKNKMIHSKTKIGLCIAVACLSATSSLAQAFAQESTAENEEQAMEEVVATGTRLKGSASAVMQERQNQAFVADILGAEQIARTGDSDAASALKRVTGLTLVDGKFIYVRGLGERYSSTELNSMSVPSPDPTRSVIPLDLFPSSIIESLSVQKSFSPDMPAHFGGGNVDIRTKSIPNDRVFNIQGQLGFNTNNNDDSPWYKGSDHDWQGRDDGTRDLSATLSKVFSSNPEDGLDDLSDAQNVQLLSELNRDISATPESLDPNVAFGMTLGYYFDLNDDMRIGFLASAGYSNNWLASKERNVYNLNRSGGKIGINEFEDGQSTEHTVRWSGMLNIGFQYNKNHKFELNNVFLHDTRDRFRDRLRESTNTIDDNEEHLRVVDIVYEEREMAVSQLKGTHNLPDYWNAGFDWYYSESSAERDAPGGFEALFSESTDTAGNILTSRLSRSTPVEYSWQTLQDEAKTFGWNASIPVYGNGYELEFKAGADFFDKARVANNITLDLLTRNVPIAFLEGNDFSAIFSDSVLADSSFEVEFEDQTNSGDKFVAATKTAAYYLMADVIYGDWRITGGVRYEDFKQISIPNLPHKGIFDANTDEIQQLLLKEDAFYPSIAVTYQLTTEALLRFNYSQTTIRPDLRDLSTSFYVDPLTDLLVRGSTSLESSDLQNFDVRWEWYMADGNNISAALFYKDIDTPIELIEIPTATEGSQQLLSANGETGELYGLEVEFLHDLGFLGDFGYNFYVSGNFTVSDSEVTLGLGDANGLFLKQLSAALPGNPDPGSITNAATNNVRRLVGHSEWVANLQMGYDSANGEHSASLVYNVFGDRIIIPGANGFDDGTEQPFHSLDLVYTYYPTFNTTVRVRARNILNEEKQIMQEGVIILSEDVGTNIDIRFSWDF
jgi:TonB-dependent receptor